MNLPIWSLLPFAGVLLSIALLPGIAPHFWKKYRTLTLSLFSVPVFALCAALQFSWLIAAFSDYVSFICLLGALYSIGGGLYVHGVPKANPITNVGFMMLGALLGTVIGTLAASMLLIRPLIRSNRGRKHEVHVIVFFIFIVSNVGGILTPLSNPPLFIGYLSGVPFWWGLKLLPIWLFILMLLGAIFLLLDIYFFLNDPDFRGPLKQDIKTPFSIVGRRNLFLIPLLVAALLLPPIMVPHFPLWQVALRVFILFLIIFLTHRITPPQVTRLNNFSWEPFKEVALIFAAIFITMVPAIHYLESHAYQIGLTNPWSFFWISGLLSGVLDNAPTYAAFFAVAQGLGKDIANILLENGKTISEPLLYAITCGSIFMGGLTYLGNGPNLLVKSVAEEEKIKMPAFLVYCLWSLVFLVPVVFVAGFLFI